jgi:hypothetical protein
MIIKALNKVIKSTRQEIKFWEGTHLTTDIREAKEDLNVLLEIKKLLQQGDDAIAIMTYNRLPHYIKAEIEFHSQS